MDVQYIREACLLDWKIPNWSLRPWPLLSVSHGHIEECLVGGQQDHLCQASAGPTLYSIGLLSLWAWGHSTHRTTTMKQLFPSPLLPLSLSLAFLCSSICVYTPASTSRDGHQSWTLSTFEKDSAIIVSISKIQTPLSPTLSYLFSCYLPHLLATPQVSKDIRMGALGL